MKKLLGTLFLALLLLVGSASAQIPWVYPLYPFMDTVVFDEDLQIAELSAAPSHVSGYGKVYALSADNKLYYKNSSGNTFDLSSPTGGDAGDFSGPSSATDNAIVRFDETGGKTGQNSGVLINDSNDVSGVDKLEANECFTFDAVQTATGDGTTLVNWGLGNVMYFTFGSQADTFTFTAPPGVAKLTLVLKQDGTGSRTATWPGTVLWPGNVAPTLSTTAAYVDIVTLLWDGTNYFGLFNGDFR